MVTPALHKLGLTVRQLRLGLGLSQEKLAEHTGLHRTYIGGIERGERNVSVKNLLKVARALGVTVADLVQGIDTPD